MSGLRTELRELVCTLGTAYLRHPVDDAVRAVDPDELYRRLLRVVFGRLVRSLAVGRGLVVPASLFAPSAGDPFVAAEVEDVLTWPLITDPEALGSTYESLLALVPRVDGNGSFDLVDAPANARRAHGSWYTPPALVDAVLDATLEPALDEAAGRPDPAAALLAITCCDPAVGSGRFLVAAARRIATRLASTLGYRPALAAVVATCVYGVDVDATALELARAALWFEADGADVWSALSVHLKLGDALLGTTPALVRDGIPDVAYTALAGDDRDVATQWRRHNASERHPTAVPADPDRAGAVADLWCAAFLVPKHRNQPPITQATLDDPPARSSLPVPIFHWPLEFPRAFDVVIGNPPFAPPLRTGAGRTPRRQLVRAVSGFLGGPKADDSSYFLLLADRIAAPSGRIGMVLPDSFLSAADSADIRAHLLRQRALTFVWRGDGTEFGAGVTAAITAFGPADGTPPIRRHGSSFVPVDGGPPVWSPDGSWAPLVSAVPSRLTARPAADLGSLCTITADYRDQYYGLRGAVREDDGTGGAPLLTTGLIDVLRSDWGVAATRFDHVRYERPVVDVDALSPSMQRWARTRLTAKLLVATQGVMIEPVLDVEGCYLPCVPVITITDADGLGLDGVAAVLLAPPVFDHVRAVKLGSGLSASTIKVSAADLRDVPVPSDLGAVRRAARLLPAVACGDELDRFGDELTTAYGLPVEPNPDWLAALRRSVERRSSPSTPGSVRPEMGPEKSQTSAQEGKLSDVRGRG